MTLHAKRFVKLVEHLAANHVENMLEIGVCKGDTAIEMLRYAKNKNMHYYGIDLFEDMDPETYAKEVSIPAHTKNQVSDFLKSVNPNIHLFQGFSRDVVDQVKACGVKFGFIFIDGGHSYETVKGDFEKYVELLEDNGVIYFDDYTAEPGFGVKTYVDELIANHPEYKVTIVTDEKYTDNYRGYTFQVACLVKSDSCWAKTLHICTCLTDSYKKIYHNMFVPTLVGNAKETGAINVLHLLDQVVQPGEIGTTNFRMVCYNKLHFIYEQVKTHQGDNLIFLDLDIVFFSSFKEEINRLLQKHDMVLQDNDNWLNTGVWAMNCNKKVQDWFEQHVLPLAENLKNGTDIDTMEMLGAQVACSNQVVTNTAIRNSTINAGKLPTTYYSNHLRDFKFPQHVPSQCVLFHATSCGHGAENKTKLLTTAYEEIRRRR